MASKPEQLEYMKLRKSLDNALCDHEVIKVDYEYDLGKRELKDDVTRLLKDLSDVKQSLVKIREMMR